MKRRLSMHLGGKWKSPFRINVRYARYPGTFRHQKHERLPHLLQCWRRPLSSGCLLNCHRTISSMPGPAKGSAANEIFYSTIFPPGGGCEKCRAGLAALAGRRVDRLEETQIERIMDPCGGPGTSRSPKMAECSSFRGRAAESGMTKTSQHSVKTKKGGIAAALSYVS
jgi:hypothetical protein